MHEWPDSVAGTATGSQGTNVAALFDNTSDTQVTFSSQTPWVQYKLSGAPQKVNFYTLTSGAYCGGDPSAGRSRARTMECTGRRLISGRRRRSRGGFRPGRSRSLTPGSYSYYKLDVTQTTGGMPTTLSEVEFLSAGSRAFDGEGPGSIEGQAGASALPGRPQAWRWRGERRRWCRPAWRGRDGLGSRDCSALLRANRATVL